MGLISAATIALCGLFVYDKSKVVYYTAVILLALSAVIYCALDETKYQHASRTMLVVSVLSAIVVACYIVYYKTGLSERFSDFDALKNFILDSGVWGALIFIGLTVFQVVVLPIPEAVTILLGVAIYGATWSFVLSVIGTVIGSLISFAHGKEIGQTLIHNSEPTRPY